MMAKPLLLKLPFSLDRMSPCSLPDFRALIKNPRAAGPDPMTSVSTTTVLSKLSLFGNFGANIFFLAAYFTVEFILDAMWLTS